MGSPITSQSTVHPLLGRFRRSASPKRLPHAPSLTPQIENMAYPVTVDAINTVFSPYGFVQKIAIFEKNNGWQVRGAGFSA